MNFVKYTYTLLSAALLASCGNVQKTDNAQVEADISPVIPKIAGTVARVLVADNQVVKEGDTLLVLDDANYRIAVQQAELALQSAQQGVAVAKSNRYAVFTGVNAATESSKAVAANLIAANAQVTAAKVRLDVAAKNFERYRNLLEQQSVTQQQYDGIKAEKDAAEQQLKMAEGQVAALQQQSKAARTQVATVEANVSTTDNSTGLSLLAVKQAEQALEAAKLQLSYCVITAPAGGVISKKSVQKGQVVAIGQPLMAVTDHQQAWIVANFKETQVGKIKVGQEVEIELDAYDDQVFKGKVASIAQATGARFSLLPPDNATGNFVKVTQRIPVKIVITEGDRTNYPLRAGMSANVNIKTN